jgi:NitT/TauT family transport system permease protein
VAVTLRRAALGYGVALIVGGAIGIVVVRSRTLRAAVGSLITGLQTMPSIAWFPLAILLFKLSETAILFVVVLGAAPAIANGLISGIDQVPPLLLRAGRVLGARGLAAYRYIILPAALPSFVAGLKQGWAFAWRSLMAGELLVLIPGQSSIGARLQFARDLSDAPGLIAMMIVILVIGIAVDILIFGSIERSIRTRRGLVDTG